MVAMNRILRRLDESSSWHAPGLLILRPNKVTRTYYAAHLGAE